MSHTLVTGDCREVLVKMQANYIDACVTDPPYELGFMGKSWDKKGIAFEAETWAAIHRVLKPGARLLAFGGSRTHHRIWCAIEDAGFVLEDTIMWIYGSGFPKHRSKLKPAYEPICVARKGVTTDLNIDACRIGTGEDKDDSRWYSWQRGDSVLAETKGLHTPGRVAPRPDARTGRWPANVVLDEEAAKQLDAQSGAVRGAVSNSRPNATGTFNPGLHTLAPSYADTGGASRFFYCAKADRAERNHGLDGAPQRNGGSNAKGFTADVENGQDRNRPVANHHPTVKPVDLMRWLVRLVTLPNDTILDPFMGSGTTGVACMHEGREFVGIEQKEEYAEIALRRICNAPLSLGLAP